MTARVAPVRSPALSVVAPYFLLAPLGLGAAGLLLGRADHDALLAINLPNTVATTHAAVLGWLTTAMMGAVYQLGPVVLGGRLWSEKLARVQLAVHVVSVSGFVFHMNGWNTGPMVYLGAGMVASFVLFLANVAPAVVHRGPWALPRAYLAVSLCFLVATMGLGFTWVLSLHYAWFPITFGRLSAHAHLGLAGWAGLTLMGVSYQLVMMFNVVNRVRPRFGWIALPITATAVVAFAAVLATDPPPAARFAASLALAAGPALWAVDILRLLHARQRRRMDIQGHATCLALAFLAAAAAAGLVASTGQGPAAESEPARMTLAYGILLAGGWMGLSLIGNSFKIVPFLVWFHRYRPRAGSGDVPVVTEIYSEHAAHAVLFATAAGVAVAAGGAVLGVVEVLQAGGAILALAAAGHLAALAHMFLPKHSHRSRPAARGVTQ